MNARLLLPMLLLSGAATAQAGVFPYPYQTSTLANGLTIVMVPMPGNGLVSYYSIVRTGSRDEYEPGHSGFAHFFEHMMFRGTEKYPAAVYDRIVTSLGADANAYTTDDYTAYHLNFAASDLARVVEIEADRFQHLAYAEREFQTEAGAVYGEYRKGRTNPFWVLFEKLQDTAFDAHTYEHTTIGFEQDVAAMPTMYEYSRSFFRRYYRPENVVIVLAGDFEPQQALAMIEQQYAGWQLGYVKPQIPVEPEQKAERRARVSYPGQTLPILAAAWKGAAFDPASKDVVAASVLGELAFGSTSPLYDELVLEKRLVQELFADVAPSRDPGLWGVAAMVSDAKHLPAVEAAIDAAVARLQESPPEAKQVEDQKKHMRYRFLMRMDTPDNVAGGVARYVALTGGLDAVDELFATLDEVTPEDVQRVARKYFTRERRTVVVLEGVQP